MYLMYFMFQNMIVLLGTARTPGPHKFVVHYYLPTESGQDIPVTLFANGQEYKGNIKMVHVRQSILSI